jgi:hypothetical protein
VKIKSKSLHNFYNKSIHLKANSLQNKEGWFIEIDKELNNLISEYK